MRWKTETIAAVASPPAAHSIQTTNHVCIRAAFLVQATRRVSTWAAFLIGTAHRVSTWAALLVGTAHLGEHVSFQAVSTRPRRRPAGRQRPGRGRPTS